MILDLLASRTGCLQILARITLDLRLATLSLLNFVTQLFQTERQFGTIDRGTVLLRPIELVWLDRVRFAFLGFSDIEEHDMSMKLRCRVAVHRTRAVMLKDRRNPFSSRLSRVIASQACLNIFFNFVQGNLHALSMGLTHLVVAADECRQRDTFWSRESSIPARAMFHRANPVAMLVHVFTRRFVPHKLLTCEWMLTICKACKLLLLNLALQSPLLGELAVPLSVYSVAF